MKIAYIKIVVIFICVLSLFHYFHYQIKSMYTWRVQTEFFENTKMITVTTYNIQFGKGIDGQVDLQRTIHTLQELNADIISLQEVERYSVRSQFKDQVTKLANELEMNAVFYPSLSYPGLYYGNVILSKFPIIETTVIPFNNKLENRTAILATLELTNLGNIYVINTHLGLNQEERNNAIYQIYETIRVLDGPIILTGDLNSTPNRQEYYLWNDLLTKSNKGTPIQTFYSRNWQIDYIFHSDHFIAKETFVTTSEASDHFPVTSKLYFDNSINE